MRQGGASSSPSDGAGPSVVWPLRYVVERLFQNQRQQQQQSGKHQQPSKVRLSHPTICGDVFAQPMRIPMQQLVLLQHANLGTVAASCANLLRQPAARQRREHWY